MIKKKEKEKELKEKKVKKKTQYYSRVIDEDRARTTADESVIHDRPS